MLKLTLLSKTDTLITESAVIIESIIINKDAIILPFSSGIEQNTFIKQCAKRHIIFTCDSMIITIKHEHLAELKYIINQA